MFSCQKACSNACHTELLGQPSSAQCIMCVCCQHGLHSSASAALACAVPYSAPCRRRQTLSGEPEPCRPLWKLCWRLQHACSNMQQRSQLQQQASPGLCTVGPCQLLHMAHTQSNHPLVGQLPVAYTAYFCDGVAYHVQRQRIGCAGSGKASGQKAPPLLQPTFALLDKCAQCPACAFSLQLLCCLSLLCSRAPLLQTPTLRRVDLSTPHLCSTGLSSCKLSPTREQHLRTCR